jgi:hypothetical protein
MGARVMIEEFLAATSFTASTPGREAAVLVGAAMSCILELPSVDMNPCAPPVDPGPSAIAA